MPAPFRIAGVAALENALTGLISHAESAREWYVGTVVEYAPYLEFGTSKMDPHPYFKPAMIQLATRLKIGRSTAAGWQEIHAGSDIWKLLVGSEAGPVQKIAFALEGEVKKVIREKGLIDTGNLRASISAAPTLAKVYQVSQENLIRPETSV